MKPNEHLDPSDQEMIEMLEEQTELREEDEHLEAVSLAISSIKLDSSLKNPMEEEEQMKIWSIVRRIDTFSPDWVWTSSSSCIMESHRTEEQANEALKELFGTSSYSDPFFEYVISFSISESELCD